MVYAYLRVSTKQQNLDRQFKNLDEYFHDNPGLNPVRYYSEKYTGTTCDRPEWNKLLKAVKSGDTIVFDSISRMSRNADEGCEIYKALFDKQVSLCFLKEPQCNTSVYSNVLESKKLELTTTTGSKATDNFLDAVLTALNQLTIDLAQEQIRLAFLQSEKEVTDLHARVHEGMVVAKLNGKQIGRVGGKKYATKKETEAKAVILKYSKDFNGSLADPDVITLAKISRNSYYKYKRELLEGEAK